jgi:hypothetical protein
VQIVRCCVCRLFSYGEHTRANWKRSRTNGEPPLWRAVLCLMRVQIPRVGCSFRHRFAALYGQSLAFAIRGRCWGCEGPPSGAVIASDPVTSSRFWAPRPKRSAGRHAAVYRVGCLVRRARFGCTEPNCRLGRTRKTMLPSRLWSGLRRFAEVELV